MKKKLKTEIILQWCVVELHAHKHDRQMAANDDFNSGETAIYYNNNKSTRHAKLKLGSLTIIIVVIMIIIVIISDDDVHLKHSIKSSTPKRYRVCMYSMLSHNNNDIRVYIDWWMVLEIGLPNIHKLTYTLLLLLLLVLCAINMKVSMSMWVWVRLQK